jgi:hypothetical protein
MHDSPVQFFNCCDLSCTLFLHSGLDLTSGENTTLTLTKQKLGSYNFDWAMLVCETIKVKSVCEKTQVQVQTVL